MGRRISLIILKLALAASLTSVQGGYNRIPPESPYQITIYSTTDLDDTNDLWGPFEISTHVVSPHGIAGVFLYHLEDGDSTFKIEEMSHVQDDLYVTSIEGPGRGGGVIQYFIHAVDSSFSVKRDPENAPLDTYESQIFYIPDFFSPDSVMGIESLYPGSRFSHQWEDLDGDADIDLYIALPSPRESNIFYRNEDGKNYTDITDISGLSLPDLMSVGIASGDYDNDGYCDLAVIASISNPILFHNGSDGIFEDVSEAAGFTEGLIEPTDFLWVDADVDGYIDLLVVAEDGVFLYMNNDGVYFQNEAAVRGLPYNDTNCVGVLAFDADADGDSEILLLGHESMFFENEAGHFVDMTSHSGLGGSERGGLILDADSDCDMDLLLYDETMKVFLNNGSGSFTDMSSDYGVTMMGSKPVADDLNNDGLPDFGLLSGSIFIMDTDSSFIDVSQFNEIDRPISLIDVNADGLIDIFTWLNLLRLGAGFPGGLVNSWLEVDLVGRVSNTSSVGAIATLYAGGLVSTRVVTGKSPMPKRLHFGFEEEEPDSLVIRWPTGAVQVVGDLPADTLIVIEEDSIQTDVDEGGYAGKLPVSFVLLQNYPNPFNPTTTISFEVSGAPGELKRVKLSIMDSRGRHVRNLVNAELAPGIHRVMWDGRDEMGVPVSSGVYLYSLKAGDKILLTKKMVVLR